jgi:pimeloyl-ACP methyl ester carboxylesterase
MQVAGVEVLVEGRGSRSIVMIHGWPDTHRLWDPQVALFGERYRCVRFTLPGFDDGRTPTLDDLVETIRRVVEEACSGERVTLLVHDWGCVFGYQFALRHPQLVARVIGIDVGDAGSRGNLAELGVKGRLLVLAYQLWLATAWRIGGALGDRMARLAARVLRCPVESARIHAHMGYPYAMRWFGVAGGLGKARVFHPQVPMLYIYGERKPFMFHSRAWADELAAEAGSRVLGLPTGHWVMIGRRREFNEAVLSWLAESESDDQGRSPSSARQNFSISR